MSFFTNTASTVQSNSYFAAANTQNGFISFCDRIFTDVKRIYAIKAGPGTGKSTLIAKIAAEGENRGLEVQKFYCSSDQSSLDGVIVGDRFAVIDATPPHVFEPRLPRGTRIFLKNIKARSIVSAKKFPRLTPAFTDFLTLWALWRKNIIARWRRT